MAEQYDALQQNDFLLEEANEEELCQEHKVYHPSHPRHKWFNGWKSNAVLITILLISFVQNRMLYGKNKLLIEQAKMGISKYTGLPANISVVYQPHTDYTSENATLANEMWENLNVDPTAIALPLEYIKEHNLLKSSPFPWDTERVLYFPRAFHNLHCLKFIHKVIREWELGIPQNASVIIPNHIYHCLDAIRQDVECQADDMPMPYLDVYGEGQVRQCRNFTKLVEWATTPERDPCYRRGHESYRFTKHKLEMYAHCPVDSPYYPIAKEYFEKHGHQKLFEDDDD